MREWQTANAAMSLADLIDAAVNGSPQLIRRGDGKAVVVVSKDYFDSHRPTLKNYLLHAGYAPQHDAFDDALRDFREEGSAVFESRQIDLSDE